MIVYSIEKGWVLGDVGTNLGPPPEYTIIDRKIVK